GGNGDWSNENAVLAFAANADRDEGLAVLASSRLADVAPAKIAGLRRAQSHVRHAQHEFLEHLPVPLRFLVFRFLDPLPRICVESAVFLRRERFAVWLPTF